MFGNLVLDSDRTEDCPDEILTLMSSLRRRGAGFAKELIWAPVAEATLENEAPRWFESSGETV